MIVRWLSDALADLRAIKAYIAERNPEAAQQVVTRIRRETTTLTEQPYIGRIGRIPHARTGHQALSLHRRLSPEER